MEGSNVCSVEKLTETIKLVENLRATVYIVFDELVGGKTMNDGIKDLRTINDKEKGIYKTPGQGGNGSRPTLS